MKKLLSALASTMIVASSASTVVSCGDKPMPSLSQNAIYDGENVIGRDITNWDAAVVGPADVKSNFLSNVNQSFTDKDKATTSNIQKLVETDPGDDETNVFAKILGDYEDGASTDFTYDSNSKLVEKDFAKDLNFQVFDEKNNNTLIATWADGIWTFKDTGLTIKEFTDTSGQYQTQTVNTVEVRVEITPVLGNDDHFVGARANLKEGDETKKFYEDNILNGSDEIKNQAALYNGKEFKAEKAFDYRYDINFNFSAK